MQYGITYNKLTRFLMFSLLVSFVSTATAEHYTSQGFPKHSPSKSAQKANPWALEEQGSDLEHGSLNKASPNTAAAKNQMPAPKKMWRYVTPEILESLKQQQTQLQHVPGQNKYGRYNANRSNRRQPSQKPQPMWQPLSPNIIQQRRLPVSPYEMNPADPMYKAPTVSPWSHEPDGMYRGESFSDSLSGWAPVPPVRSLWSGNMPDVSSDDTLWAPNEGVDGLPPILTPSFGNFSYGNRSFGALEGTEMMDDDAGRYEEEAKENVFNPFTFIQNRHLH